MVMKNLKKLFLFLNLALFLYGCGYTPIFEAQKSFFQIEKYETFGDKKIANLFIERVKQFQNATNENVRKIHITVSAKKKRNILVKNTSGKVLTYQSEIALDVKVKYFPSDMFIFEGQLKETMNYKNKDQKSEMTSLENKIADDLVDSMSRDLILIINQSNEK